ncbi:DUF86 domain-containing protein [Leptolyngbya sp. BL0902]|uniref:HepT-like ribonuclease domain-containing protein n=1 Tax=Leptolyngbya sp. BL0902 TaxID=1115757 RepID=UPI0018E8FE84|nr:DUF86 domain-containing protein [Leptolyngbya sp. BL0902]QQE63578.1 DUF86 domain-containing protein [Leptolyngbya sp. BL0902]
MLSNRDHATLLDIFHASQKILRYKYGMDKEAFLEDDRTQSAIVFQLLIIGEAVKRLSSELRMQNPNIPWSLIAGMRDKLIHRYDDIDLDEVWKTAEVDIPGLLSELTPMLPGEQPN